MKRRKIDFREYAKDIIEALPRGILLTTKADGKVNSMVIGWGTLGINWRKPVFAAYVRKSRYTHDLLEKNPEFTVNVPVGSFDPEILSVCGSKSGRELDKLAACGLTAVDARNVSVPALKELPLTLECRVMYRQDQDAEEYDADTLSTLYPSDAQGVRDIHTTYFGEIVDAYILEEE